MGVWDGVRKMLVKRICGASEAHMADIFTVQASLAGVPAISLPTGNNSKGLPLGLQLLTSHFNEQELLNFSKYFVEL